MSAHEEHVPEGEPKPAAAETESASRKDAAQAAAASVEGESLDILSTLQDRLSEMEARQAELEEQLLRARAETENVRRRAQDDVAKARKFGIESFAESLVPVKDSLEAALAQPEQAAAAWQEGVEVTLRQLITAFERNQLVEIAPQVGDKFDPHHHQAISSVPGEQPSNTIVQVLQKGYLIADRVLRPALVMVAA